MTKQKELPAMADCACGKEAQIYEGLTMHHIHCGKRPCWTGPSCDTVYDSIIAWNKAMDAVNEYNALAAENEKLKEENQNVWGANREVQKAIEERWGRYKETLPMLRAANEQLAARVAELEAQAQCQAN